MPAPPIICFPFIGDHVGGSHISALGLIRNLDQARYAPLVVLHQENGPLAELLTKLDVPFETAPIRNSLAFGEGSEEGRMGSILDILKSTPQLMRYLRGRKVRIVHTNDGRVHVTWGLAARLAGAKVLWHHRSDPRAAGLRLAAPWLANRLAVVSHFAAPKGPLSAERKSTVVRSPFDLELLAKVDRNASRARLVEELGCGPDTFIVGYVGTMQNRKRPIVFVDAIAEMRRLAPDLDIRGVYLGGAMNGFEEKVRSRATELGVGDRIHLLGFRYPGEPWLAALDVLLVTAVNEPFGRTLIEAMLLNVAVVAAASGGNLEAIEHGRNGLLCPPDDATAFAEAVIGLGRSPSRRSEVSAMALQQARRRYGISEHVATVTRIYDDLLAT